RFEEAIAELTRALATDPLLAEASMTLGSVYVAMGQAERGVPYLREVLELAPDFGYARELLAGAYLQLGKHDEAIADCERAAAITGARGQSVLAEAYAIAGRRADALAILDGFARGDGYQPPAHIARVHAALGDIDAAFAWLERGVAEHDPFMGGLNILPDVHP